VVSNDTGVITVVYDTNNLPMIGGMTLILTPFVAGQPLVGGTDGPIDWACTSASHATAMARNMGSAALGTLTPRYAPNECQ
jgi:type IV pilus assembly protein PilA